MPKKKSNAKVYIIALVLLLGGLGALVYSGLSSNSVYFLNVSEALAMEPAELGSARLFGNVDGEGLQRLQPGPGVKFRLLDKDDQSKAIWVEYRGAVPDTFKPGVEVIVEGAIPSGNVHATVFGAKTLMTKCPSKYQKENRES